MRIIADRTADRAQRWPAPRAHGITFVDGDGAIVHLCAAGQVQAERCYTHIHDFHRDSLSSRAMLHIQFFIRMSTQITVRCDARIARLSAPARSDPGYSSSRTIEAS